MCTRYNMRLIYIANTNDPQASPMCYCAKRVRSSEKLAWLGPAEGALLAYVKVEVPALNVWAFFLWQ